MISVPIQSINRDDLISNENIEDLQDESWDWWSKMRSLCEETSRLGLILGKKKKIFRGIGILFFNFPAKN